MKPLSWLFKASLTKGAVYDAIQWKSERYLNFLIKNGADVNEFYVGMPFLMHAFLEKANGLAFVLLEKKANPNGGFITEDGKQRKIIEDCIGWANMSQAKLLVYYGAELKNIDQYPELEVARQIYQNKILPLQNQKSPEAYKQLSEVWNNIAETENDNELKKRYQLKSVDYYQQFLDLKKKIKAVPQNNIHEELQPFIMKTAGTSLRKRFTK